MKVTDDIEVTICGETVDGIDSIDSESCMMRSDSTEAFFKEIGKPDFCIVTFLDGREERVCRDNISIGFKGDLWQ